MKKIKKLITLALSLVFIMGLASNAYACTGVIVGKDLTSDGSFIYGRTEDYERNRTKRLVVHPRGEFKKGSKLVDVNNGFEYIHPEDSCKFFSTPDSTKKPKDMEQGVYDAAGYNEYGLGAFCTVSAWYSDDIEKVDPYIENGVNEASMSTFILAHAKNAKDAIKLLAKTIDEKGASMGDIVVFGDKNEVWYMEIYSGHQYVAIKYPSDKFSVFPNTFWLGGVDLKDTENVIASKDIVNVAKKAKTYVETKDGLMDMAASYAPKKLRESNRSRMWSGIHSLDPNSKIPYNAERFPLMNDLSEGTEKIDIKDVFAFTRNRFENTEYKASETKKELKSNPELYKYPIGNINTMQSHIFQIKKDFPKEAPGIMWLTLGSPLNTPYIPVFADINDSTKEFKNDSPVFDENSYYWVGSAVNDLVTSDRDELGKETRDKILNFEDNTIKNLPSYELKWNELYSKDKKEASDYATEITNKVSDEAYNLEKNLMNELSENSKVDIDRHWANKAILSDIKKGYIQGIDKLHFAPDKNISRADFVTILGRMARINEKEYTNISVIDVKNNAYYAPYVSWAMDKGIVKGYGEKDKNLFAPSKNITREEMATMILRYLQLADKDITIKSEPDFKDTSSISPWAKEAVATLSEMKVLQGDSGMFLPDNPVTRAEVAQVIYNITK